MTQRCGRCKLEKDETGFSPFYRGKKGTWCRACFAAYNRGVRDTTVLNPERICDNCGQAYRPRQMKPNLMYCGPACKEAHRKSTGQYRRTYLHRKYGITIEEYERLLAEQGGGCALCDKKPHEQKRYSTYLHVDHDHESGVVRGLLCDQCNLALGRLGDSVQAITRVLDYISRPLEPPIA